MSRPATIRTVLNNFKLYVKPVVYDSIKRDEKAKDGVVYGPRALTEKERAYLNQLVDLKKTGLPNATQSKTDRNELAM